MGSKTASGAKVMIFILTCLAVWRICHFVAKEDGPFHFMFDIRYELQGCWFGELISCVDCLSIYFAAILALAFTGYYTLYLLSISAIVMFLEMIYGMLWTSGKQR